MHRGARAALYRPVVAAMLVIAALLPGSTSAATTLTVSASADGQVNSGSPNGNPAAPARIAAPKMVQSRAVPVPR